MAITSPNINITFKQLASSAVERSERGYAILIIRDDTKITDYIEYDSIDEVDEADYTATNYKYISDIYAFAPHKVCIVRIATEEDTMSDALKIIKENVKTGWITVADGNNTDFTTLQSWISSMDDTNKLTYKAVVYKTTTLPDNKHIVNFVNDDVTFTDPARGKVSGLEYCPSLIGILARCNITQGCNYFICGNLSKVTEVADNNAELGAGKFVLFNDGKYVRILRGINSMTAVNGTTKTDDMKEIEVVEAMDTLLDDIRSTFKNEYLAGGYKNKYDNQILFISAVNGYFSALEKEDVLDEEYENIASINVEAQREAWLASGKTEASTWTDVQVKQNTFKKSLFMKANVKILESMVDLDFVINLD